jgi:solute carrier family 35, member C2
MAQHSSTQVHDTLSSTLTEETVTYSNYVNGGSHDHVHLATVEEKKRRWWRNAFINVAFIASWYVSDHRQMMVLQAYFASAMTLLTCDRYLFATILSVYNKWMFSPEHFGFPFPIFVTMMHMYVQFVFAAFLRAVWPRKFRPEHTPSRRDYA